MYCYIAAIFKCFISCSIRNIDTELFFSTLFVLLTVIICVLTPAGLTDGMIRTYDLFTAYDPGYFSLEILACDYAGHCTTTNVNIYILRDDQRVKIVFNDIPDFVRENQEDFINLLSNITGATVNLDDIQVCRFFFYYINCVYVYGHTAMLGSMAVSK